MNIIWTPILLDFISVAGSLSLHLNSVFVFVLYMLLDYSTPWRVQLKKKQNKIKQNKKQDHDIQIWTLDYLIITHQILVFLNGKVVILVSLLTHTTGIFVSFSFCHQNRLNFVFPLTPLTFLQKLCHLHSLLCVASSYFLILQFTLHL